jgi:hypothetical protein
MYIRYAMVLLKTMRPANGTVTMAAMGQPLDDDLIGMCGAYCGACAWRERSDCPGCQSAASAVFWGECRIAACAMGRGPTHCGLCPDVPCAMLRGAFADPEHGDRGERVGNLRAWAKGERTYLELRRPDD